MPYNIEFYILMVFGKKIKGPKQKLEFLNFSFRCMYLCKLQFCLKLALKCRDPEIDQDEIQSSLDQSILLIYIFFFETYSLQPNRRQPHVYCRKDHSLKTKTVRKFFSHFHLCQISAFQIKLKLGAYF